MSLWYRVAMVPEIRLFVAASSIDSSGIAKIDRTSFEKLNLRDGMKVIVKYGTKSKEMAAKCDPIFSESTVRLMAPDIEYLRVEPGKHVLVSKKGGRKEKKPAPTAKKGKRKGKRGRKPKSEGNTASLDSF